MSVTVVYVSLSLGFRIFLRLRFVIFFYGLVGFRVF